MNIRERSAGFNWLRSELEKPTTLETRVAACKKARDAAHDPDMKIMWAAYLHALEHGAPTEKDDRMISYYSRE